MKLGRLIAGLGVRVLGHAGDKASARSEARAVADVRVCDLTEDSRTVLPGSLFVARGGLKADGKRYIAGAIESGAVAVLCDDEGALETVREAAKNRAGGGMVPVLFAQDVLLASSLIAERFYGRPGKKLDLVGVTGTNGKTTTTALVWQLLNRVERRCGLIGTVMIDDGREVGPASMTTPPSIELSRTLATMVESGCEAATLEVSSHALDQRRVDAMGIEIGIFTNLTGDHLDYHKTMEQYAGAKARLFEMLPVNGTAIVNVGDDAWRRMVRDCRASVVRCAVVGERGIAGIGADADATVEVVRAAMEGMRLRLDGAWGRIEATVPLVGNYNAMNILQAAVACHVLGLSATELTDGLEELVAPPGRLERVLAGGGEVGEQNVGDGVHVFVDYAHSDDSLRNVLRAVGGVMEGRGPGEHAPKLIAVFGCGGDRDTTKRPRMGRAAAELADRVVVTSDNPRTERPSDIVDQVLAGIPANEREKVSVQVDRERAILAAIADAKPGDVVVIAGKGHETEQILPDGKGGTYRIHFDDREVARRALTLRLKTAGVVEVKVGETRAEAVPHEGTAKERTAAKGGRGSASDSDRGV